MAIIAKEFIAMISLHFLLLHSISEDGLVLGSLTPAHIAPDAVHCKCHPKLIYQVEQVDHGIHLFETFTIVI